MEDVLSIRETTTDDASGVQRVARASWHAVYDEVMGSETVDETVDSWFETENVVADVNRSERPFYVAERNGEVVGFVIAIPDEDEVTMFHLYRIYVHPAHWDVGIGTRLLERLETEARSRGAKRLRLSVIEPNKTAIAFYESKDFERIGDCWDEQFDVQRYVYSKELRRKKSE